MADFVTKSYCQVQSRTTNFLLGTLAVLIVAFLTIAIYASGVASEADNRAHAIEVKVENQLGANDQFRQRVLSDLSEIKTQLNELRKQKEKQ